MISAARPSTSLRTDGVGEAGFTLVELIVSLAIFALLAVAGLALVDGILGIQRRTAGRIERLGDVQRALSVMSADLGQAADGPVAGGGDALLFSRPTVGGLPGEVRYGLADGGWTRTAGGTRQMMLPEVAALRFRFWTRGDGWLDRWPPGAQRRDEWPAAVEMRATLGAGQPGGTVRRLVLLPARP